MQQFGRGAFGNRFPAILALVYAGNETSATGGEVEEAVGPFGVEHDPRKLLRQVALHLEVCDGRIGAVIASPVSDAEHPPDAALRPVTPEGKRRPLDGSGHPAPSTTMLARSPAPSSSITRCTRLTSTRSVPSAASSNKSSGADPQAAVKVPIPKGLIIRLARPLFRAQHG